MKKGTKEKEKEHREVTSRTHGPVIRTCAWWDGVLTLGMKSSCEDIEVVCAVLSHVYLKQHSAGAQQWGCEVEVSLMHLSSFVLSCRLCFALQMGWEREGALAVYSPADVQ